MSKTDIHLVVNGVDHHVTVAVEQTLLEVLREELGLVGAREGCGIGMCGACTALIDGQPISACLMLAVQAQGKTITTVEGLAEHGHLHPIQQAFIAEAGYQCAYCTSGFILSAAALLAENPAPDDKMIRDYLSGNLCRCGSYENILRAVRAAIRSVR